MFNVQCIFTILSGQGTALNIDPYRFVYIILVMQFLCFSCFIRRKELHARCIIIFLFIMQLYLYKNLSNVHRARTGEHVKIEIVNNNIVGSIDANSLVHTQKIRQHSTISLLANETKSQRNVMQCNAT
jgi:hypothetical protein